jgi:outer membrane protein assembly factor BamB
MKFLFFPLNLCVLFAINMLSCQSNSPQPNPVYIPQSQNSQPSEDTEFQSKSDYLNSATLKEPIISFSDAIPLQISKLKWKVQTNERVYADPVIKDGVVYIGSLDGNLYAIDINSGEVKWKYKTSGKVVNEPEVSDDVIYLGGDYNRFHFIRKDNGWEKFILELPGGATSALRQNGILYFGVHSGMNNGLWAVNEISGEVIWKQGTKYGVSERPWMYNEFLVFTDDSRCLYFVNPLTGVIEASYPGIGGENAVIVGNSVITVERESVISTDLQTRQRNWTFETGDLIGRGLTLFDGLIYFGGYSKYLYALNPETGLLVWKFRTEGTVYSNPIIRGDHLIISSCDNRIYMLDRKSGEEVWRYKSEGDIYSKPAISNGIVVFGCLDGCVYAIE